MILDWRAKLSRAWLAHPREKTAGADAPHPPENAQLLPLRRRVRYENIGAIHFDDPLADALDACQCLR